MYSKIPMVQPKSFLDAFNEVGTVANALTKGQLENQINKVSAKYAPYTQYADALSKIAYANYLPYQIQSQILSNPSLLMSLKDNPEALANLAKSFSSNLPSVNQIAGGGILPTPDQVMGGGGGGNAFHSSQPTMGQGNAAANAFAPNAGGKGNLNNSIQTKNNANAIKTIKELRSWNMGAPTNIPTDLQPPSQLPNPAERYGVNTTNAPQTNEPQNQNNKPSSGLLPVTQGPLAWLGNLMAENQSSPYKPGALIQEPNSGKVISVPTEQTVQKSQNILAAHKRVEPVLKSLSKAMGPYLTAQGKGKLLKDKADNFLFGGENESPSDAAYAEQMLATSPEQFLNLWGLNPNEYAMRAMTKVVQPVLGETPKTYEKRILKQLEDLENDQVRQAKKQLREGFDVGGNNTAQPNSEETKIINGAKYHKMNGKWYHD